MNKIEYLEKLKIKFVEQLTCLQGIIEHKTFINKADQIINPSLFLIKKINDLFDKMIENNTYIVSIIDE